MKPNLSDAELEAHIGDCARLMEQAVYTGNRVEAEQYRRDMYAAIGMRSPEQIRRMELERGLLPRCETFVDLAEQDLGLVRKQAA